MNPTKSLVQDCTPAMLAGGGTGELALWGWHASPLTAEQAIEQLEQARQQQRAVYRRGESCPVAQVREMIARFWLDKPIDLHYLSLHSQAGRLYDLALTEMVYGQLLMIRRLRGVMWHLDAGLACARALLATADYFTVLRRHELLRHLSLADAPRPPQDLPALLTEAAVIRRLENAFGTRHPVVTDRSDTLG